MNIIKCIVVDDEPLALQLVCDYVRNTPGLELVYQTTHATDALHFLNTNTADLIFLDIHMSSLSGFDFLGLIQNKCKVILVTAYQEYALKGFDYDVVDYLLKPISFERFLKSVKKAYERIYTSEEKTTSDYFFVKTEYKAQKINHSDVLFLEGLRDYTGISTKSSGKILSLQPLWLFEQKLPKQSFIRIHKSYIISIEKIEYVERNKIIINGEVLPIGETYREIVLKRIGIH